MDSPAYLSRLALLCDFDGTIARQDVGHVLFDHFAGETSRRIVKRWLKGEIGSRECLQVECSAVDASREELLAYVGDLDIDPTFRELVTLSREAAFPLVVVSDGLDFYIRHILERHGLGDLPVFANQAEFEGRSICPVFPYEGKGCGECGNCKGHHAELFRRQGYRVVFVGDGLSDRCGVEKADLTLAKAEKDLARWCTKKGHPHLLFRSLGDVAGLLRNRSLEELIEEAGRVMGTPS